MSRVIRSRRAGLSRDQARLQPLYARVLGLQYLTPSGFLCFVFFEGAISLGVLLALAELVSWWGVLVLPVTVAVMVKLNDVVAGAVSHPTSPAARSRAAQSRAPQSRTAQNRVTQSRATQSRAGRAGEGAAVPAQATMPAAVPMDGHHAEPVTRALPAASSPALRRAAARPPSGPAVLNALPDPSDPAARPPASWVSTSHGPDDPMDRSWVSAGREPSDQGDRSWVSAGHDLHDVEDRAWGSAGHDPHDGEDRAWGSASWVPEERGSPDDRVAATRTRSAMPAPDVSGAGALNGPPAARQWAAGGEQLDSPEQWARQAASRRYE